MKNKTMPNQKQKRKTIHNVTNTLNEKGKRTRKQKVNRMKVAKIITRILKQLIFVKAKLKKEESKQTIEWFMENIQKTKTQEAKYITEMLPSHSFTVYFAVDRLRNGMASRINATIITLMNTSVFAIKTHKNSEGDSVSSREEHLQLSSQMLNGILSVSRHW